MARTYLPTLLYWMDKLCAFMQKYETQIKSHLTDPQISAFNTLLVACQAFRAIYPSLPQGD